MKGFIVDRTYRLIDGQAYVYLFGRLANGESFLTMNAFAPYFYVRTSDATKAKRVAGLTDEQLEQTERATMAGEPVTRVTLTVPKDVAETRTKLEEADIPCYEADIRFTQRFLMDKGITATLDIHGKQKKGKHVDRIYEEPELTPVNYTPELRVASIDIETSLDGKELYAISIAEKETITFLRTEHHCAAKATTCFATEKELLEMFATAMQELDPDIITGWNVIDFDLEYLRRKCEEHNVPFVLGRTDWASTLRIESSFLKDSRAEVAGRMVLDGIHVLKSSFIQLDDYKLETAAQEFLGEGKLVKGDDRHEEIERLYAEEPEKLVEYNRRDAELVLEILESRKLVRLTVLRSMLTGMTLDRVRASIASFDSVYIRALNEHGKVAPTTRFTERGERITGGFVRESKPGIYENILVLDFKSMYPSVIRTFNIDPASYLPGEKQEETDEKVIVAPNGACFRNEEGLLPTIIQRLWEERDRAKKERDGVASQAIKTLMNSFFGVLASPNCRFFSLEMGNAITGFARHFIKLAAEKIEEEGYDVIYGDTDSVFVATKAESPKEAFAVGKRLEEQINRFYTEHVTSTYHRDNFMQLEAEKVYHKFLMPRIRGSEAGAKKRYAGLLWKDGEERLDFTGLEFVRRDWTELAKTFQLELLDRIFHDKEVTEYVKRFVEDVKAGKHDEELVYRKGIRKELSSYTKTTPPHVKAARILEQKGRLTSSVIEYVMTEHGPEPVGYTSAPLDYEHYIEKQVKPIADSVLAFYGTSFDDVMAGSSQTTLGNY